MGLRFQVSASDVKRSKLIKPGWYLFSVVDVRVEKAKDGQSNNIVIDLVGKEGDAKDVPVRTWISEKAPGLAVPAIKAFGGDVSEETGADFDFEGIRGMDARLLIETGEYEGRKNNSIKDWAPASNVAAAPAPTVGAGGLS